MTNIRLSNNAAIRPNEIHASEYFPNPYPSYPKLMNRTITLEETKTIEELRRALLLSTNANTERMNLSYEMVREKVLEKGQDSLNPDEEALMQFGNVLYCFCYDKRHRGALDAEIKLNWTYRRMRGAVLRHEHEIENNKVQLRHALDKNQVDQILEEALQRNDYGAIRAILNYEGYEVPVVEPNDLIAPTEWDNTEDDSFDDIEIEITPEEHEIWKAPLLKRDLADMSSTWRELLDSGLSTKAIIQLRESIEPQMDKSALQKAVVESMAKNIPTRLESHIRRRDVGMLRTMLRLYGHNIYPNSPDVQDCSE